MFLLALLTKSALSWFSRLRRGFFTEFLGVDDPRDKIDIVVGVYAQSAGSVGGHIFRNEGDGGELPPSLALLFATMRDDGSLMGSVLFTESKVESLLYYNSVLSAANILYQVTGHELKECHTATLRDTALLETSGLEQGHLDIVSESVEGGAGRHTLRWLSDAHFNAGKSGNAYYHEIAALDIACDHQTEGQPKFYGLLTVYDYLESDVHIPVEAAKLHLAEVINKYDFIDFCWAEAVRMPVLTMASEEEGE